MKADKLTYRRFGVDPYGNRTEEIEITVDNPKNLEEELRKAREWTETQIVDRNRLSVLTGEIGLAQRKYDNLVRKVEDAEKIYQSAQEFLVTQGLKSASDFASFPVQLPALPPSVEAEVVCDDDDDDDDEI